MTLHQNKALWELQRQGLQVEALHAESAWRNGKEFDLQEVPIKQKGLLVEIEMANWETIHIQNTHTH